MLPKATTPNEPARLSFMISSMRSRLRPEKRPSTASMKPSQWRPPDSRMGRMTRMALAVYDGRPRSARQASAASR